MGREGRGGGNGVSASRRVSHRLGGECQRIGVLGGEGTACRRIGIGVLVRMLIGEEGGGAGGSLIRVNRVSVYCRSFAPLAPFSPPIGVLAYRHIGISAYRCIGVSVYRCIGVSVYRCIGVSVYRRIGCIGAFTFSCPPPRAH